MQNSDGFKFTVVDLGRRLTQTEAEVCLPPQLAGTRVQTLG